VAWPAWHPSRLYNLFNRGLGEQALFGHWLAIHQDVNSPRFHPPAPPRPRLLPKGFRPLRPACSRSRLTRPGHSRIVTFSWLTYPSLFGHKITQINNLQMPCRARVAAFLMAGEGRYWGLVMTCAQQTYGGRSTSARVFLQVPLAKLIHNKPSSVLLRP